MSTRTLQPIPEGTPIATKEGTITLFFRLAWQALIDSFVFTPTVSQIANLAKTAAIATAAVYTTRSSGLYRISYYLRKTVADGVSSSLQVTFGWTDRDGTALTQLDTALTTDTVSAHQSGSIIVYARANTDLTYAVAYASNTPQKMTFNADVMVEAMA